MAQEEVRETHGQFSMPNPVGSMKTAQPDRDKRSPADKMKESYYDGLEVEAFRKAAGITDDKGVRETGGMPADVAQVVIATVNAQSQALTNLMTKIVEMQGVSNRPVDDERGQFMQYLVGEVRDMKSRLEGPVPDPLAVIEETSKRIDSLTDTMRKRMGIPETLASGAGGVEGMKMTLEIENMRNQAQERQNQFEMAMKTMERQWHKEDKKWEAEFRLRSEETRRNNENREKAITALQDLTSSVIESIETEPAAPSTQKPAPAASSTWEVEKAEPPNVPTSFTCDNCGEIVKVAPGKLEAKCGACDAEYDLRPST